ncbi:hypothetical protein [Glutamicibacter ardleyensis]|uniref:hypothetical protein n=1 Tax=Glutamicibacter ardleyensis TaxID=225894 RepID=UPI003FD281A0
MSSVDFGALIRENFDAEEGDEWEPLTSSTVKRLLARGIRVSGEDVRRAIREFEIETRKVDRRLLGRSSDIDGLVDFLMAKRSEAKHGSPPGGKTK